MVDVGTLALDILETTLYFVAPALLWWFVFALAYLDADLARSAGFDRRTFWLLIPMVLLGEFANILFFGFGPDLLAINVGGGLIPIALSLWLLYRILPDPIRSLAELLGAVVVATGLGIATVELDPPGNLGLAVLAAATLAPAAGLALVARVRRGAERPRGFAVASAAALFAGAVLLTTLTTSTIPGLGIVSAFPAYLLAPVALGIAAAFLVQRRLGDSLGPPLAMAYATVTLGVLVGADVLHQPPLFAGNLPALYAIGGAGILDLLHLSGLLALFGAYLVVLLLRRSRGPGYAVDRSPASPSRLVRRAWFLGLQGRYEEALRDSARAAAGAATNARQLWGLPPDPRDPWAGLPAAPWVARDHANLQAVARRPVASGREAYRGWLTARALVTVADAVSRPRRASPQLRTYAFALDLALIAGVAAAGFLAVLRTTPGTTFDLFTGLTVNAAVVAVTGWGLVYFLGFESVLATTPGKRFFGLAVVTPDGRPPGFRAVWLRNIPRVVPLSILAYALAFAALYVTRPWGSPMDLAGELLGVAGAAAGSFLIVALLSLLTIGATEEGQRLGDLLAGTWVIRPGPTATVPRPSAGSRASGWWHRVVG
ncbi:MAG TPA: RDD family protein [Thermoplasmata archaeon]|nr:RDD family protein [Thermoplasmata archaeon]